MLYKQATEAFAIIKAHLIVYTCIAHRFGPISNFITDCRNCARKNMDAKILAKSPFIEDFHSKEKIQLSEKENLNIQTSVSGMDEENVNGLLREGL